MTQWNRMGALRPIHYRRLALGLAMALPTAACGGDSPTEPPASIAGTYFLRSLDGQSPPVVLFQTLGFKIEILSGRLTMNEGASYSMISTIRITENTAVETVADTTTGTYVQEGSAIRLTRTNTPFRSYRGRAARVYSYRASCRPTAPS